MQTVSTPIKQVVNQRFHLEPQQVLEKGVAVVDSYIIDEEKVRKYNLYNIMDGTPWLKMSVGHYVRLKVGGQLMMSDTDMEVNTNADFVENANGRVMIAGLGIGLILHKIAHKVITGEITEIVVYEKFQDVIDLVSPFYKDLPVTYKNEDILEYLPPRGENYDTIYFDIWPEIADTNLDEISMLHIRWKGRKNKSNPKSWMGSWMAKYLRNQRASESRRCRKYREWGWPV